MKYIQNLPAAVLVAPFLLLGSAIASDSGSSICERSANLMKTSCSSEVKEEYQATIASCINFSDRGERADCRNDAKATRIEDRAGCRAQRVARRDVCNLLQENRYDPDPLTDPTIAFVDPNTIGESTMENPYLSLKAGTTQVLRAG